MVSLYLLHFCWPICQKSGKIEKYLPLARGWKSLYLLVNDNGIRIVGHHCCLRHFNLENWSGEQHPGCSYISQLDVLKLCIKRCSKGYLIDSKIDHVFIFACCISRVGVITSFPWSHHSTIKFLDLFRMSRKKTHAVQLFQSTVVSPDPASAWRGSQYHKVHDSSTPGERASLMMMKMKMKMINKSQVKPRFFVTLSSNHTNN